MNIVEAAKAMQPLRPLLELTWRLGAAEHQDAEHGDLVGREADLRVEQLAVLRGPAPGAARQPGPPPSREALERVVDLALVVEDDRIAVRRLIAREPESVERERVLVGRRSLLLEQAPQHAQLDRVGVHARRGYARFSDGSRE